MEVFPGVTVDTGVRFGKACIAGTRMDVATVLAALGAGESYNDVERDYNLTREHVLTALRYAAHVAAHLPTATNPYPRTRS